MGPKPHKIICFYPLPQVLVPQMGPKPVIFPYGLSNKHPISETRI
jgi:hypothetical protein